MDPSSGRAATDIQISSTSTSSVVDVSRNGISIPSLPLGEEVLTRNQKRNRKRKPDKRKRRAVRRREHELFMQQESLKRVLKGNDDSHTECSICMEDYDLKDRIIVKFENCRHMSCNECFLQEMSISKEPKCHICRCPHSNKNANESYSESANSRSNTSGVSSTWSRTYSSGNGWGTRESPNNSTSHYTWGDQPHQRILLPRARSPSPSSPSSDSDRSLDLRTREYMRRRTGILHPYTRSERRSEVIVLSD